MITECDWLEGARSVAEDHAGGGAAQTGGSGAAALPPCLSRSVIQTPQLKATLPPTAFFYIFYVIYIFVRHHVTLRVQCHDTLGLVKD